MFLGEIEPLDAGTSVVIDMASDTTSSFRDAVVHPKDSKVVFVMNGSCGEGFHSARFLAEAGWDVRASVRTRTSVESMRLEFILKRGEKEHLRHHEGRVQERRAVSIFQAANDDAEKLSKAAHGAEYALFTTRYNINGNSVQSCWEDLLAQKDAIVTAMTNTPTLRHCVVMSFVYFENSPPEEQPVYWRFLREHLEPAVLKAGEETGCGVTILRQPAYFRQVRFEFNGLSGKVQKDVLPIDLGSTYYVCETDIGKFVTQIFAKVSTSQPVPPIIYAVSDCMTQSQLASRLSKIDGSFKFYEKPQDRMGSVKFLKILEFFKPAFAYARSILEFQVVHGKKYQRIDMQAQWDFLGPEFQPTSFEEWYLRNKVSLQKQADFTLSQVCEIVTYNTLLLAFLLFISFIIFPDGDVWATLLPWFVVTWFVVWNVAISWAIGGHFANASNGQARFDYFF
jgi:hypothetical protein